MLKSSRTLYPFALVSFLTLFVAGCQEKKKSQTSEGSGEGEAEMVVTGDLIGQPDPIANTNAKFGGSITTWGGDFPKSLNYYLDPNYTNAYITGFMFDGLFELHSVSNEYVGILAESWEISEDKMSYTVKIRDEAMWSDGNPVTAHDIQFYYDVIMNPDNLTPVPRVSLKRFNRPEVLGDKSFKVSVKENHWKNELELGSWVAFPKHAWEGKDFNKINFEFPVVYGPYKLSEVKKGRTITLKRRKNWWGRKLAYNQHKYNVDRLTFRFIVDRNIALEAFKKGDMDIYPIYTASIWAKKTEFEQVNKGWVVRQKIHNKEPLGFQGFAINLRREKFSDVKVRKALCHLLNRDIMNEKLMHNAYFMLNSFYGDLFPGNKNPSNTYRGYDPDLARKLLDEAGWKVGSNGMLAKGGKGLDITFLTFSEDHRHLNVYIEDLKKVGINASIEKISRSTVRKRLDKFDYDMYWSAWSGGRVRDPEPMWHSATADQEASYNFPGVKDAVVDSLIELMRNEWSLDERNKLLVQLDTRLHSIVPYALLWLPDYSRILYWNKYGTPEYVYDKYEGENRIVTYWWYDEEKAKKLEAAQKSGESLPKEPFEIHYKE